jgi:S1-C subfamily serine protease
MARRDNKRALQNFDQAIKINPKYAIAHNNRGEVLENMNRLDEAMAAFNRAIESNPRYARAFANRGDIWRRMSNELNAIADYKYALSIDRNNSLARAGLKILGVNIVTTTSPTDRAPAPTRPPSSPALPKASMERKSASTGTGFFVSQKGHVLTNHHVVENCSSITVALEGTTSRSARVTARDSKNDLALLATTGLTPSSVPSLRLGVRLGESVFVYGFPLTGLLASTGNFTTGIVTAVAGLGDDTTLMQVSAPIQPGNSGGPVLDQHGNVIAVVVSKLNALRVAKVTSDIPQNINFAIKSGIAMSFLEAGNVSAAATASTSKLDAPQIAERARAFTVQIRCH